jgi:hypothetical protein
VAEVSNVSRAWLYKYIGKKPDDLIDFSIDAIGKEFAKTDSLLNHQSADEVRSRLFDGTFRMLRDAAKNPALLALYYRYVGTENPIGKKIRQLENRYIALVANHLQKYFGLPKSEAAVVSEVLHGMRMGLTHRYSNTDLRDQADYEAVLKGVRRVMKHFAIEDGKKSARK